MTKGLHKNSLRKGDNPHQWMIDNARMELIQQIKAEVERFYDGEAPAHDQQCDFDDGYFTGIDAISKFLDTFESEKPVPNDLEEAAWGYASKECEKDAFLAGAKWQAEQDTRDMYMSDNRHFNKVYELGKKDMREQMMKNAVEAEVFEYQSPLLYPEYYDDNPGPPAITIERDSVKPGDKVRIIILPPED